MTRSNEKSGLELIEEAVHLLRHMPMTIIAYYYLGTLPFIAGFLYFWTDMSFSAAAYERKFLSSLSVALLFLWMKCWHSVFCSSIQSYISRIPPMTWSFRRIFHMAMTQITLQPPGLFIIPVALLIALPFGWVYAFYQNVTVVACHDKNNKNSVYKESWKLSLLWPKQNHVIITVLFLFSLVVYINFALAIYTIPYLLKTLFAIDTTFTRSGIATFNSTFFAVTWALTYCAIDPLIKTIYCLRCFYGRAQTTGEDLKVSLKNVSHKKANVSAGVLVIFTIFSLLVNFTTGECFAHFSSHHQPHLLSTSFLTSQISYVSVISNSIVHHSDSLIPPPELDKAINKTLKEREYAWRLPRKKDKKEEEEKGFLIELIEDSFEFIKDVLSTIIMWRKKLDDWLISLSPDGGKETPEGGSRNWRFSVRGLFYFLLVALVLYLAFLMYRLWRKRNRTSKDDAQPYVNILPDISGDDLMADKLSTDKWMTMGRELAAQGELRLALRAFYLATLSFLGYNGLITIARFKSNRDYKNQLERRMGEHSIVCALFSENMSVFNKVWYGFYEVTDDSINDFVLNHEKIKRDIQK